MHQLSDITPQASYNAALEALRTEAPRIDSDGHYPVNILQSLGKVGAFNKHLFGQAQGGGLVEAVRVMADVGEICMSTAFCMWCQNTLAWYLDQTVNVTLRNRYLDAVSSGSLLGGTGLSNPMKSYSGMETLALKGKRVKGGYKVSGLLPWISNIKDGHVFATIFSTETSGRAMALFNCDHPNIRLMRNARFIALEGTATYTVGFKNVFVPDEDLIAPDADAFVPRIRQGFVLLQLGMAVGVVRGIANAMLQDHSERGTSPLHTNPNDLLDRANVIITGADEQAKQHAAPSQSAFHDTLRLRLKASELALEAAQGGNLQFGARGYMVGSAMNRRAREAQFVAIVTPSVNQIHTELSQPC